MNYRRPELLDKLAAEYALGTLRGGARRRFERLLRESPAARMATGTWENQLGKLAQVVPPVEPPARVWSAIDARTQPGGAKTRASRWSSFWKPALGFAFGVVFTTALVQLTPGNFVSLDGLAQREQTLPQSYVGLLLNAEGQPVVLASSTRHGTKMTVKFLRPVDVPPGKVLQLWALPKDGAAFPLGTAATAKPPQSTSFELAGTSEKLLSNVPRLAASFEDQPAGAGAKPSEFVLSGHCVKLW
ncbi:MAG TPA: anti-sigma factor [Burkholderiaceae bacterium]|nr:anti-sigma factor [Burkholderiaceae bacterium]